MSTPTPNPPTPGLTVLAETFAIHRLPATAQVPEGLLDAQPVFVARTAKELSIACPQELDPGGEQSSAPWRCLEVDGPLDFSLVGVLAGLTRTLAAAGVSVFAVSTFDTDYILVGADALGTAERALRAAGHGVRHVVDG